MTLKTTKEQHDSWRHYSAEKLRLMLGKEDIDNLCHDADLARELEKEAKGFSDRLVDALEDVRELGVENAGLREKALHWEGTCYNLHELTVVPMGETIKTLSNTMSDLRAKLDVALKNYHELLFQVSIKQPGETRHETAMRYLNQAEQLPDSTGSVPKEQEKP